MIERQWRRFVFAVILATASPVLPAANQHEFQVRLQWMPEPTEAAAMSAVLEELLPDGRRFESEGVQPWKFDVRTTTNLLTDFGLSLQGMLPFGYTLGDLRMSVPFDYERPVEIWLVPTLKTAGAESVRHLYATDIKEFSIKRLYSFYQESRAVALQRIDDLKGRPDLLHAYDLQAVFKFLEASLELNRRTHSVVRHSREILDTRDWLLEMRSVEGELVDRAIGTSNYRQIVDQIADEEAYLMTHLWAGIRSIASFQDRLPPMRAFYDRFKRYPDVDWLEGKMRLPLGTVLSSLNQCVIEAVAKNDEIPRSARASYLTTQVDETRSMLGLTENQAVANMLRSDIEVMKEWIVKLER